MNTTGTPLFLLYEPEHLLALEARLRAGESYTVVALDYELELDLRKRNIPFTPLRELVVFPEGDRDIVAYTRRMARGWHTAPELAFFRYEGIALGEQHEGPLLYYFQMLLYYLVVLGQVYDKLHPDRVIIPELYNDIPPTADATAAFKERLPADVAQLLADHRAIPHVRVAAPLTQHASGRLRAAGRGLLRYGYRVAAGLVNLLVTVTTPPRPIKLLVTDPWSRLEPFIKNMNEVELVMTRRSEMGVMKGDIWKTRARFHHRLDFVDKKAWALARRDAEEFSRAWGEIKDDSPFALQFAWGGISYWPIARQILGHIVTANAVDAIITIENTKRLCIRRGINCVLLFSSVKGYNNLIARVAEKMNIPSIELQHALSTVEPSHPYSCLPARYLAAYGDFTRRVYEKFGVDPARVVSIGSPRFDAYAAPVATDELEALRRVLRLDERRLNVLVAIPVLFPALEIYSFTSYAVQGVLEDFSVLQKKHPNLRFLLRPKSGPSRKSFYTREETLGLFSAETRMAQSYDLRTLFGVSDLIISGNSALVLEAMLAHKPVVMYLPKKEDLDFQEFEDAGAVRIARTIEELSEAVTALADADSRAALVERADRFFTTNFTLDGKSNERIAALIRRVTKTKV